MPGASLTETLFREALSDMRALKPHRGKLTARDFKRDDGNVGIIRGPIRAIFAPDRKAQEIAGGTTK